MPGIARVGDSTIGTCYAHEDPITVSGVIVSGEPTVITEGMPTARLGDTVVASCGHTGTIVSGSMKHFCGGMNVARLGDKVAGAYVATIISAAQKTIDEG